MLLHLDHVSKLYTIGDTIITALDDLSIDVEEGEYIAITGHSGSGKSTLLQIASFLDKPTSGNIYLRDTQIDTFSEADLAKLRNKEIGFVFQQFNLLGKTSALENVGLPLIYANVSDGERKQRAQAMLEDVGLGDRLENTRAQLSGGQRQRIAIAQQLLCSEKFLLMDEPFSGLDPLMVDEVCRLISEVAMMDEQNTIIVVTHDITAAILVADTLWIMGRDHNEKGEVIPGAKIKSVINLMSRGLAWHKNIAQTSEFAECVREVRALFPSL